MRPLFICLIIALLSLQYKLWLGDGNVLQWHRLQHKIALQTQENMNLLDRNHMLEADIVELKRGDQALEEQARYELGMIKEGEVYYQFKE